MPIRIFGVLLDASPITTTTTTTSTSTSSSSSSSSSSCSSLCQPLLQSNAMDNNISITSSMPIRIFGVLLDASPTTTTTSSSSSTSTSSCSSLCQPLLQSNAIDNNNNNSRKRHRDGRILPTSLTDSSNLNQESVHAWYQEQHDQMAPANDPWSIKKTLTKSDVNALCRLLLGKPVVREHILSKWDLEKRRKVMETEKGVTVDVWDVDTKTLHEVTFKKWKSSKSFVFGNNWVPKFVRRRNLKEGDKIGLYWDSNRSRFCFCVLACGC